MASGGWAMKATLFGGDGHPAVTLSSSAQAVTVSGPGWSTPIRARTLHTLVDALRELAPPGTPLIPVVPERPCPHSRGDALLLLALADRWPYLSQTDDVRYYRQYHLTLAYALPVALDPRWRAWAAERADLLVRGRQLVAVPATDLVAVVPNPDTDRRHRRLLRKHGETEVREHADHGDFLHHWSTFTTWRYGRSLPDHERDALRELMAMSGCVVREFTRSGEVIARSVVCLHERRRVSFDLMATWHPRHAALRPGIFSAVHNLTDALHRRMRFSLCYGQFPYKDEIVGPADRLALDDLMFG
ncbi:MAG: GNAT family N-acetyltransferase [Actinobacteria bacterium]|nr:GNAT family N-acetyltransferase [Actinomycetota bacterium]